KNVLEVKGVFTTTPASDGLGYDRTDNWTFSILPLDKDWKSWTSSLLGGVKIKTGVKFNRDATLLGSLNIASIEYESPPIPELAGFGVIAFVKDSLSIAGCDAKMIMPEGMPQTNNLYPAQGELVLACPIMDRSLLSSREATYDSPRHRLFVTEENYELFPGR